MAWIIHWKTTAAMAAVYAAIAALAVLLVRDTTTAAVILVSAFGLVLLCGNIYLRFEGRTKKAELLRSPHRVPGARPRDPEYGRR